MTNVSKKKKSSSGTNLMQKSSTYQTLVRMPVEIGHSLKDLLE
ncbi:MAG TPA: hypothetical protein VLK78_09015 [Candidatus Angelobacter sp.]|nr:hypothetical protein [Candidatus Angelobacter sp.]